MMVRRLFSLPILATARGFALDEPEPGPFVVVQVLPAAMI
jgi:hypothetical protein